MRTAPPRSFSELFARLADERHAGGVADHARSLRYVELFRSANALAPFLDEAAGGRPVGLLLPRGLDFVIALVAASRVSPLTLILNPRFTARQLARAVEAARPGVIVTSRDWADRLAWLRGAPGVRGGEHGRLIAVAPSRGSEVAADGSPRHPAVVLYTSGTTGDPKGVIHLQERLLGNAAAVARCFGLTEADVALIGLPLHHSYGLNHLLAHACAGARSVLVPQSSLPGVLPPEVWAPDLTNVPLVPTTLKLLLPELARARRRMPRLRFLTSAGGPLPPSLVAAAAGSLPDVALINNYGQTEAGPRVSSGVVGPDSLPGYVGRPLPDVLVRVADESGRPPAPGCAGEVLVRTPSLMAGYLGAPEETRRVLADGWLHTGDLGLLDAEDRLCLTGRLADVVQCGGVRISAGEIEEALLGHPAVVEAAVVAVAHSVLGEVPKAFVVPVHPSLALIRELTFFCRTALAPAKVPREIVLVDELPRTSSGKVMKACLK